MTAPPLPRPAADAGPVIAFEPAEQDAGNGPLVGWLSFSGDVTSATARGFIFQLTVLASRKPDVIVIELRTDGGGVDAGLEMAKAIERVGIPTICVADGDVASEGIFLLQTCDVRIMTDRSTLMAHQPYLRDQVIDGNVDQLVARQQSLNWAWTQHVGRRWTIGPEGLRKRLQAGKDWWMAAPEALKVGAVDAVIPDLRVLVKGLQAGVMPAGLKLQEQK